MKILPKNEYLAAAYLFVYGVFALSLLIFLVIITKGLFLIFLMITLFVVIVYMALLDGVQANRSGTKSGNPGPW